MEEGIVEASEMRELFADTLNISAAVKEILLTPTPQGRLHYLIRISRPNWSARECFKAGRWIRRNGLKARSAFSEEDKYLEHINKQLLAYDRAYPVRGQHAVADELALSRWEARWERARSRQMMQETRNSLTVASLSSAA